MALAWLVAAVIIALNLKLLPTSRSACELPPARAPLSGRQIAAADLVRPRSARASRTLATRVCLGARHPIVAKARASPSTRQTVDAFGEVHLETAGAHQTSRESSQANELSPSELPDAEWLPSQAADL